MIEKNTIYLNRNFRLTKCGNGIACITIVAMAMPTTHAKQIAKLMSGVERMSGWNISCIYEPPFGQRQNCDGRTLLASSGR